MTGTTLMKELEQYRVYIHFSQSMPTSDYIKKSLSEVL